MSIKVIASVAAAALFASIAAASSASAGGCGGYGGYSGYSSPRSYQSRPSASAARLAAKRRAHAQAIASAKRLKNTDVAAKKETPYAVAEVTTGVADVTTIKADDAPKVDATILSESDTAAAPKQTVAAATGPTKCKRFFPALGNSVDVDCAKN